jgi:hypothetical protein
MESEMYALVSVWNVEKGREEEQQRGLEQRVVPAAQQAPGFVAGHWTSDQAAGKAYAMILLDSEEAAHQLKAIVEGNAKGQSEVGISPEVLTVAKVMAHADSAARPVTQT